MVIMFVIKRKDIIGNKIGGNLEKPEISKSMISHRKKRLSLNKNITSICEIKN